MAKVYKILGQSAPNATTNTDVYTVGSGKQVVVSTITICNRSGTAATYRIAVRPNGDAIANEHYIAYDSTIGGNDTVALTIGLTIDETDIITAYASTANLTFNIYGCEIS